MGNTNEIKKILAQGVKSPSAVFDVEERDEAFDKVYGLNEP
jgi:hypothetical protein